MMVRESGVSLIDDSALYAVKRRTMVSYVRGSHAVEEVRTWSLVFLGIDDESLRLGRRNGAYFASNIIVQAINNKHFRIVSERLECLQGIQQTVYIGVVVINTWCGSSFRLCSYMVQGIAFYSRIPFVSAHALTPIWSANSNATPATMARFLL